MTEKKMQEIATEGRAAVKAKHPDAIDVLTTFSDNDLYIDVQLPDRTYEKYLYWPAGEL